MRLRQRGRPPVESVSARILKRSFPLVVEGPEPAGVVAHARGSGTMLSVGLIACGAALAVALAATSGASLARQNLTHAADAAALAAADTHSGFVDGAPCDRARSTASAFGASVSLCAPCGGDHCVEVTDTFLGIAMAVRSRAGAAAA